MSRFANPNATDRLVLGPCQCPGTPHTEDWMDLRSELSGVDLANLETAPPAARMRLLVKAWNLLDDEGNVAPLDDAHFEQLYLDEFEKVNEWLTENAKVKALPNASAAPSRGSSRASGSRTPTAKTGNSSMTPSWQAAGASATSATPGLTS